MCFRGEFKDLRRGFLLIAILCVVLSSSSCSFVISFKIRNLSDRQIFVSYFVEEGHSGLAPKLFRPTNSASESEYVDFPADRLKVDLATRKVQFAMLPGDEVQVFWLPDQTSEKYKDEFGLTNLVIESDEGSVSFMGDQVFQAFRPIEKDGDTFGPSITGFVLDYR